MLKLVFAMSIKSSWTSLNESHVKKRMVAKNLVTFFTGVSIIFIFVVTANIFWTIVFFSEISLLWLEQFSALGSV